MSTLPLLAPVQVEYKWFPNLGLAAEARCHSCSWTVTATTTDLIDSLRTDAIDHMSECPAHGSQ